ncbi:MAG: hypothetical protein KGP28_05215 [Bdellovibrionales bacterium]|nr:hypothetical protein [Bdellovibrionales bacterium]
MRIQTLFEEKNRLLQGFLKKSLEYKAALLSDEASMDMKIDLIDELSDTREQNLKLMQVLDREIEAARRELAPEQAQELQSNPAFKTQIESALHLIKEIQLTDQSLFLYIQTTGSELRAQILKSLKEKEAVSKFKSQSQGPLGDEIDKTV